MGKYSQLILTLTAIIIGLKYPTTNAFCQNEHSVYRKSISALSEVKRQGLERVKSLSGKLCLILRTIIISRFKILHNEY